MDLLTLSIDVDKSSGHKVVNLRYELLLSIGQGQFGKVILARDKSVDPAKYYAIKTINRIDTSRLITKTYLSHTTKIKREIRIMKQCDHPNVVKLYQVIDDMKFDKILLVLEYCQYGEIDWKKYNHYHEKYFKDAGKSLPLNKILRDVLNGLEYLHTFKHIIHRDLKPSNLLISRDRTIKISDFGVSLILENNANDDKELGKTMGTPAFFAPELCQFVNKRLLMLNDNDLIQSKIDARIDIWSLGVILFCLFFHQLPFEGHNEFSLFKNIVNGPLRFPRTIESAKAREQDSKEAELLKNLIEKLLSKDPNQRPTIQEIKAHPFTTFGLSRQEIDKYNKINQQIFKAQGGVEIDNSLTGRLRRLFIGKTYENAWGAPPPLASVPQAELEVEQDPELVYKDLEKVDDLLDSYLDDSSSMGSLEDEVTTQPVDTSNLLSSIDKTSIGEESSASKHLELVVGSFDSRQGSSKPESSEPYKLVESGSKRSFKSSLSPRKQDANSIKSVSPTKLRSNALGGTRSKSSSVSSKLNVPPPLQLSESNLYSSKRGSFSSDTRKNSSSGFHTPISGGAAVTIGAGSPLSIKSMFSPSRRFFSRLKKEKKPTIGSLASVNHSEGYGDFEPPPGVGGVPRTSLSRRGLTTSVDSGPIKGRKNSMSSMGLNMLLKLSSSSSSLNLHAYLMDDSGGLAGASTPTGSAHSSERINFGEDVFDRKFILTTVGTNPVAGNTSLSLDYRRNEAEAFSFNDTYTHTNTSSDYNEDADRTFSMDEYLEQLSARR